MTKHIKNFTSDFEGQIWKFVERQKFYNSICNVFHILYITKMHEVEIYQILTNVKDAVPLPSDISAIVR